MHNASLRISLIDNRPLVREVLSRRINDDVRFRLISQSNLQDALHLISVCGQPELLLVAVESTDNEAVFSLTRQLRAHSPGTAVVALFDATDELYVLPFLEAGACACAYSHMSWDELAESLLDVRRGRVNCSQRIIASVFKRIRELSSGRQPDEAWRNELSGRECEVARLLALGWSNKEISQELTISLSTTKNHVHSILSKLQVSRRRELLGHAF